MSLASSSLFPSAPVRRHGPPRRLAPWRLVMVLALPLAGCGKQGPPLAPFLRIPAAVADLAARRLGDTVELQFTIPTTNADGSRPVNIDRVEVYGYTGPPVDDERMLKLATLVAKVEVKAPAEPGEPETTEAEEGQLEPESETPPFGPELVQGSIAVVTDTLTPEALTPVTVPGRKKPKPIQEPELPVAPPLLGPGGEVPTRMYFTVGVSRKGKKGPLSTTRLVVPLVDAPPAPSSATISYTAEAVTVAWTAPTGGRQPVQEPASGEVLPGRPIGPPAPARGYHVYDVSPLKPDSTPAAGAAPVPPTPPGTPPVPPGRLTTTPLTATEFEDTRITWGSERCYAVRTVETVDTVSIESTTQPPACVTLVDTFPPAAPKGLAAVATEGAISLIWEPGTDKDLAGYLVLRAEAPGATLQPITPAEIRETTYRDAGVKGGVHYVYAVIAVDSAKPPNRSAESNKVEETAR